MIFGPESNKHLFAVNVSAPFFISISHYLTQAKVLSADPGQNVQTCFKILPPVLITSQARYHTQTGFSHFLVFGGVDTDQMEKKTITLIAFEHLLIYKIPVDGKNKLNMYLFIQYQHYLKKKKRCTIAEYEIQNLVLYVQKLV